ncbi:proline-rich protein HaeIII subfamily 1-like [Aotus nancymaae]|uniref:proline-rich protein HaeIII subfamily 1-like n=1 Tax=Aotus nancymaae TaxID=37293 RepID=UPI0030FEBF81
MGQDAPPRGAVRERRRPPPPGPALRPSPPPGSQRARRAAGRPNAARALAAGGPRRCYALFPGRLHFPAGAGRLPSDPHLRTRRRPLVHLRHYKGTEGRPRPPGRPPLSGPAAPPTAAASPAATARLRAGNRVPPPLPRLSELLGSF